MSNIEPQHKQSKADKIKNNFAENIAMYYIQQANILGADRKELQMLYDAADGLVDEATYAYVLNPYHTENDKLKKFPARLRNYDILSPVLKLWMGEQLRKPKGATITAFPADSENRKKQFIAENVNSALLQDFINNLNQMGVETEMATKQIEEYQKTVQRVEASFNDIMCQNGQEAFDYLYASLNIDDRIQEMLFDFIVVGRYFTFKRVYLDDVDYEVCDPRDIYIVGWGKSPYAEDADAAIRVMNMTANNVLDNFQDAIFAHDKAEEIVQWLSDIKSNSSVAQGTGSLLLNSVGNVNGFNVDHEGSRNVEITRGFDASLVTVYHITYKTFTKVGILKYYNQIGEIEKKEVDEDLIDIVYASDLTQYDEEWMNSTAESWIKWRNFDTTLIDTIEYIKTTQVNPDNVDDIISKVKGLINDRNSLTFNSDLGLDFFNPTDHFQEGVTKFSTGYNFLDRALGGGYDKDGTLVVYVGEQNIGKSIYLANDASNFVKMGVNTAVITAEMSAHKFMKRIGSNPLFNALSIFSIGAVGNS